MSTFCLLYQQCLKQNLENVSLKIINCKWSQILNKFCLKEELMPNNLNFKQILYY